MPDAVAEPEARPEGTDPDLGAEDATAVILAGLGERRAARRIEVHLPCTIHVGSQVQDGMVRDVSPGGAMLHGVGGLRANDLIRIRLAGSVDHRFAAEVRGVSLLGVHVAILSAADQARWEIAIHDLLATPGRKV